MPSQLDKQFLLTATTTTSLADIDTVVLHRANGTLVFEVTVTGDSTIDFVLQGRAHSDGSFVDFIGGVDFDSSSISSMIHASTTGPHELSSGDTALVIINPQQLDAIKFKSQGSAGGGTVTVRGHFNRQQP